MSVRGRPPTNVAIVTQLVTRAALGDLQVHGVVVRSGHDRPAFSTTPCPDRHRMVANAQTTGLRALRFLAALAIFGLIVTTGLTGWGLAAADLVTAPPSTWPAPSPPPHTSALR